MDQILIEYLKSGRAWVLVGSGPSTAMGYPSWNQLSEIAIRVAQTETGGPINPHIEKAMRKKNYPLVFDGIKDILGGQRLLQIL